jgi:flavin reductase (DIM6/NTAB) family NADH-FMN oxidoreductase RutF
MQREVRYSDAIVSKYPEQVVIAIARDAQGKDNPITLGWTMIVSGKPPMMAVAIGKTRYSLQAFRHAREFVVAFPSEHQQREAMLFGTKSGRDTDKLAEAGCPVEPACKINSVLLSGGVANFECTLVSELETGDHVVFVGKVICSHVNDLPLNRLYIVGPGHQMAGLPRRSSLPG